MEKYKIVISLLIGVLLWVFGLILRNAEEKYTLSEEMTATIDMTAQDGGSYRYYLTYTEGEEQYRIQTHTYPSQTYKYQTGDEVKFKIANYTSGAKYAIISDEDLEHDPKTLKKIGNGFMMAGVAFMALGIGLILKEFLCNIGRKK